MNLYKAVQDRLFALPKRIMIDEEVRPLSGQDLDTLSARYASVLADLGVIPGDRVAVQVEKSPEAVALYLGCLRIGAVYLPLNTGYGGHELAYFIGDAEPRLLVVDPANTKMASALCSVASPPPKLASLGGQNDGSLAKLAAAAKPLDAIVPRQTHDLAAICYTSGTTGRAKGAMITHGNLLSNAQTLISLWGFTPDDVLFHALPIYHVHGLFVALHCALLSGASIIFKSRFDARDAIAALGRATVMMGVPTFYTRLLAESGFTAETCPAMRLFVSGSAPLLPETFEAFAKRTGHRILERYGMTETGMICSNRLDRERKAGRVGWPLPGVEIRVAGDGGDLLKDGEVGIVEVRGPNVFAGYWRQPEKTKAEFRADGFFITGDLGAIGQDRSLALVGRAKDLIISGGLNVYPKEIEEIIDALPGVEESAVIGLPHPDFGEAVVAVIKPRPGSDLPPEADFISAIRTQLAGFKTPKKIFFVDDLPRNAMGKVQKNLLREKFQKMLTCE